MALIWVLLGIVVLGGVAVVAAGRGQGLPPAEPDRPDLTVSTDRPVRRADVDAVRFSVGLRGYRMDEVDDVLDRVAADLDERDARIAVLEQLLTSAGVEVAPVHGSHADDQEHFAAQDAPQHQPAQEPGQSTPPQPEPTDEEPDGSRSHDPREDDLPQIARTMIVPIAPAEPTPPDEDAGG